MTLESLGLLFSGVAAGAVLPTLWLGWRQKRNDEERIRWERVPDLEVWLEGSDGPQSAQIDLVLQVAAAPEPVMLDRVTILCDGYLFDRPVPDEKLWATWDRTLDVGGRARWRLCFPSTKNAPAASVRVAISSYIGGKPAKVIVMAAAPRDEPTAQQVARLRPPLTTTSAPPSPPLPAPGS